MERPIGTSGFEPGVNEATRRALLDLDRRIRGSEGGGGGSGEGGGGDAGPHDHDYLPLTGGTVTGGLQVDGTLKMGDNILLYRNGDIGYRGKIDGVSMFDFYSKDHQNLIYRSLRVRAHGGEAGDLQVDGTLNASGGAHVLSGGNQVLQLKNSTATSKPYMSVWYNGVRAGYFGNPSASSGGNTEVNAESNTLKLGSKVKVQVASALQVDGDINLGGNWSGAVIQNSGSSGRQYVNVAGNPSDGSWGMRFYGPADSSYPGNTYIYSGGEIAARFDKDQTTKAYGDLTVTGKATISAHIALPNARSSDVTVTNAPNLYLTSSGNMRFTTFSAAPKAFNIADGIDTQDVLDRAEVATMPAPDAEGVATADVEAESLTVNEVVTALLAKVKELTARIEELES